MIETMGLTESCAPILSNPLPPKKINTDLQVFHMENEVMITDNKFNEVQGILLVKFALRGKM